MTSILVEGTRGKSGAVEMIVSALEHKGASVVGKITGKETTILYRGKRIPIVRKRGLFFIDSENREVLRKYSHCDFKVFENQALSAYTMRAVHNIIKPDVVVIPNIRFEHQDRLGETIDEQAKSFAVNLRGAKALITAEKKERVLLILAKYCEKYGIRLIKTNIPCDVAPSMQSIYIANEVIKLVTGSGLEQSVIETLLNRQRRVISICRSKRYGIDYFTASKANDVESAADILRHLETLTDKTFCFLCYFRKDRSERTQAFAPFLRELAENRRVDKIFVAGHHLRALPKHTKITHTSNGETAIKHCKSKGVILVTAVNGVNDFMREVEADLV
ncbi:hypothetical protein ANME2D_02430 [Candidatus Methanoperedens nitroreducens]|uniref:Poly-gamma-glutamate synthase PgsB n=1 Tax=Candidatus Methanoperedens nitratireducens TaxID=1392998 RepID=A0A062V4Z6_9EURY|nr:hypothetical protein [Candidatus Methanoperedens nitroreducens]KCZ71693.1 hypothetical protein ANME2D_02430 [Candidatus Methanoperedens nitroreducens]MDJ1421320.1 hypothetical protein [Candidatus Methanoperedens sp.]